MPLSILMPAAIILASAPTMPPVVVETASVPLVRAAPGVSLRELTGRGATGSARTDQSSMALFHLEPGAASPWSHNKVGEESFFVLKGHGTVWTGTVSQPVGPGSFIVIPAATVRSIRATAGEALEFYALTTPAWSPDDDIHGAAPSGAPD